MIKFTKLFALASSAVVFTGMAYGQANCGLAAINNVAIRGESTNDIVGDLRLTCTQSNASGAAVAAGTINIQIFTGQSNVTFSSKVVDTAGGYSEATAFTAPAVSTNAIQGNYAPANAVLGTVSASGNSITFLGVPTPVLAANSAQFFSILITNIRVNASAVAASTGAPPTVTISSAVSGTPVFQTAAGAVQVAYIQPGLGSVVSFNDFTTASPNTANTTFVVCTPPSILSVPGPVGVSTAGLIFNVRVVENFPSAFRSAAQEGSPLQFTGANTPTQNNPPAVVAAGANAASTDTRVKIVFANVPSGVTLYTTASAIPSTAGGARLTYTTSETGVFSAATPTTLNTFAGFAQIPTSGNAGTAVFDITTPDAAALDTFFIPVYAQYSAGLTVSTTALTATVGLAPTGVPNNIPNFSSSAGTRLTGSSFNACSTSLLFPFVTNQAGFDTGIAISNTSVDPFGTRGANGAQTGVCRVNFYGATPNPAAFTTGPVAGGAVATFVLSGVASGFQGYAIAQCDFQYAHAFAFITNGVGVNGGLSQGYLAGVIPDTNQVTRRAVPSESLGN